MKLQLDYHGDYYMTETTTVTENTIIDVQK